MVGPMPGWVHKTGVFGASFKYVGLLAGVPRRRRLISCCGERRDLLALRVDGEAVHRGRFVGKGFEMCLPGTVEAVRARADEEGPAPITRRAALAAAAGAAAVAYLLPALSRAGSPRSGRAT